MMKKFQCSVCRKIFTTKSNCRAHLRVHTKDRPYSCGYCSKAFSRLTHLNDHVRSHTGMKPFECYFCKRRFTQSTTRMQHLNIHTGEKPYECNSCFKCFTQSNGLIQHRKRNKKCTLDKHKLITMNEDKRSIPNPSAEIKPNISDSIKSEINTPVSGTMSLFKPVAYWYRCRVCHVCILDKDLFLAHKKKHHPQESSVSIVCKIEPTSLLIEKAQKVQIKAETPAKEATPSKLNATTMIKHLINTPISNSTVPSSPVKSSSEKAKIQWKLRGPIGRASIGRGGGNSRSKERSKKEDVSKSKIENKSQPLPSSAVAKKFPKFPCKLCQKRFFHLSDLDEHDILVHQCKNKLSEELSSVKCYFCFKILPSFTSLVEHMSIHNIE